MGLRCSEDPDVKGTETKIIKFKRIWDVCCSEDPDVKGTETLFPSLVEAHNHVAARIPM